MSKKPIRVFYSPLSGRFWATQHYKQRGDGMTEITGAKYDVTSDIGHAINKHGLEFTPSTGDDA